MNAGCREVEALVSLRAGGAELSGAEAARLDRHLESCPACRRAVEEGRALLELVRLPPPDPAESLALADLPARALAALRRRERRRAMVRRVAAVAAGVAIAAGIAVALLSPAVFGVRPPERPPAASQVVVAQAGWQEPDMDTLWNASAIVDEGSSSGTRATMTDAVLSAYDAGGGDE